MAYFVKTRLIIVIAVILTTVSDVTAQIPDGTLFRRVSRASNFEFAMHNSGALFGDWSNENLPPGWLFAAPLAHWPRGSFHLRSDGLFQGLAFLAKKNGKLLVSDAGFMREALSAHGPFNQMVPGWIGDPKAGFDTTFNGEGWLYNNDANYIVYSSLDYNETGVDTSGNNYYDWPLRWVDGKRAYVPDPLERRSYQPVYLSDEDMFCVIKDTDTRADPIYGGEQGPSIPIGIEIQNHVYSWGSGPGNDIVLFQYDIINKSGIDLDSCYVVFASGIRYLGGPSGTGNLDLEVIQYNAEPQRNLAFARSRDTSWSDWWFATPVPPTIGYSFLQPNEFPPVKQVELQHAWSVDTVVSYLESDGMRRSLASAPTDSIVYGNLLSPPQCTEPPWPQCGGTVGNAVLKSSSFSMAVSETVRATIAYFFSDSLSHLLLMHDFITRVYNNNFARPSPPPTPELTATGLNRSVKLSWDNTAESATDIIIPDSLGRPFVGYKLLRAESIEGPYSQIGRWHVDTLLVYEYLDAGEDLLGGLKNNVTYYYELLSYDEGAVRLKLDPMESPAVEGVNAVSVIPTTEPSDATSEGSDGSLVSGNLGGVSVPVLTPRNTTNFNRLLSGRDLTLKLSATSNGIGYTLPVTITDSISGREHNDVVDPDLLVHGSPESAGPRAGTATIEDVFDIGAADITFSYSFEQLAEPFHVTPDIEGGSDCPILIGDSLEVTGLKFSDPYTSQGQELSLEFSAGGIDTGSTIFLRYFPYLTVRLIDLSTGKDYTGPWSLTATGVRRTGGTGFNPGRTDRYYLTGAISNGETWDFGHLLELYNWAIAFDFADHGVGSGKPTPTFTWPSTHTEGTVDFKTGDRVTLSWEGGVSAVFPEGAEIILTGAPGGRTDVTEEMMEGIRIVPNPYFVHHEAQRTSPELYFNYLPEECTIRIYTLALDLVKTITHTQGSREQWNLTTESGQLVASQMFIAHIEATNGAKTVKKFAVVVGR